LGVLLLVVPWLLPPRGAGLFLLVAAVLFVAIRVAEWRIDLGLAEVPAAAVVAAGHHLRSTYPWAPRGRWLAGIGGLALLAILAHTIGPEGVRNAANWSWETWVSSTCTLVFGIMGTLALADRASALTVRLGRLLARWGLALWVPFLYAVHEPGEQQPASAVTAVLWVFRVGCGDIALVIAFGAGLAAWLGAPLALRHRQKEEEARKVFT
jgi:hypothetical protein